jgi:hypothetical protein
LIGGARNSEQFQGEIKMTDRKFGRIIKFDETSRKFPIRAIMPKSVKLRSYTWRCNLNLDQGNLSACVGFSVAHEAAARPVEISKINNALALQVYYEAQQLDDYPGENYQGSSVIGGIKAGKNRGWYGEYRWAFSEPDLALAVGNFGPAILGLNWYSGMNEPDSNGLIRIKGELEGGHAILCNGFNVRTGLYRLHNSWSKAWGIDGDCFITRDSIACLLKEQGEACIPLSRLWDATSDIKGIYFGRLAPYPQG